MEIDVREQPTRTVAVVRREVRMDELAAFYDTAYGEVARAVGEAGARIAGPALGWYHGMPAETVDVAAGFPVEGVEVGPLEGRVEVVEIAGGRSLVALFVGPYDDLGAAWQEVEARRAQDGTDGRGDFWEEYVTDPSPDGDPSRNETLLVLPLA
ncbi:GyrI-like domain-containing protein [Cellulomonas biazotea]|uniref:Transcription activator effector-binding protein n=1 Tax=Cellulomonas biazotea TaxID=1709 RepID=A0A402DRY2_9CELL|nr:GyrI-like domain-containing protein [Cellulomonas biazotea]GCE76877.1 transcription activator effector-binding protein [Cellulomonas biazotea]